ncbi:type II toxin-antitoxin system VapC family toxin [Rhizobium sp. C4]|uniref:type II toxin-antitoxin system VapC family toxin n=1 Tax=Rhizobium sp. C4 TaxID=1349800 RepID=UPI001E48CC31|nr:type II toxin-antitoxin system VapC family toxin [Rhizobium sp. C4]MCD2173717.1 type II toxin-antitoxin system VapC family toxin [Rhizobium sp. C4]
MSVIIDTNVLVRAIVQDNAEEAERAMAVLAAHEVVIPNQTFCELIWVLGRVYKLSHGELIGVVSAWSDTEGVVVDTAAVAAGLAIMKRGGDFADGIVAFEGRRMGGSVLATFDRRAARILADEGNECILV